MALQDSGGGSATGSVTAEGQAVIDALHNIDNDPCAIASASAGNASVKAFQQAWNANSGDPQLTEDGYYGPATAGAASAVGAELGINVDAACGSYHAPSGGGQITPPSPPQPLPPTPIVAPTDVGSPPSGLPTWAKILLGILAVGAIGAIGYVMMRKPSGGTMRHAVRHARRLSGHGAHRAHEAAAEAPKPRRRRRRKH